MLVIVQYRNYPSKIRHQLNQQTNATLPNQQLNLFSRENDEIWINFINQTKITNINHQQPNLTSNKSMTNLSKDFLKVKTKHSTEFHRIIVRYLVDFVYTDKTTGLRWIATKTRSKSMSNLVSRFSWKPKINHYEKYSDIIRTSRTFVVNFSIEFHSI